MFQNRKSCHFVQKKCAKVRSHIARQKQATSTHFARTIPKTFPHALPHAHRTCGSAILRTCAPQPNIWFWPTLFCNFITLQQCSKSIQLPLFRILLANQVPECSKSYLRTARNFKRFLHFVMASGRGHQRLHLNYLNSLLSASPCFPEIFHFLEFDFPRRHLTNFQLIERFWKREN